MDRISPFTGQYFKMRSGKQLTNDERAQIDVLVRCNPSWTDKEIGLAINRSYRTVRRYLADPEDHGRRARSGRPKVTSERLDRLIVQTAVNDKKSLAKIKMTSNWIVRKSLYGDDLDPKLILSLGSINPSRISIRIQRKND